MIQSVFFFTMCLMLGEGDDRESDCSYQWFLIEDRRIFNLFYDAFKTDDKTHPDVVVGFAVVEPRLIYVRYIDDNYTVLKHEAEHARCNLKYVDKPDARFTCNWLLDRPNLTRGSIIPDYGYVNAVPTPQYSQKMGMSLNMIPPGTTQEYYAEQEALNFKNVDER